MHLKASIGWGGASIDLFNADIEEVRELLFIERLQRLFDSCCSSAEESKDNWTPVEESLPDIAVPVLVSAPDKPHSLIASFDGTYWRFSDAIASGVTHWQPLPEKPKGRPQQ